MKKKDKYILTRIKTKTKNIRIGLFLRRTPSLEYNIIHNTLLSENKWNLLLSLWYIFISIDMHQMLYNFWWYLNVLHVYTMSIHFQSLLLWAKWKSTLSYVYPYKGGGGYPAHTEKCSVAMSNTFAASAVTATQISPTSVAAGSCHVVSL